MVRNHIPLKKVLFVGGLFDEPMRRDVDNLTIGGTQAAADALQWGYVTGIDSLPDTDLTIISSPFVGSYPRRYKKIFIKSRKFHHTSQGNHRILGFLNLPLVKHAWRAIAINRATKQWVRNAGANQMVIGYPLSFDVMWALSRVRRYSSDATTAVVIPDLPEHMNTSESPGLTYTVLKGIESRIVRSLLSRISSMVVLTRHMLNELPRIPSVVIEGIAPPFLSPEGAKLETPRTVMYAGTLNSRYGVLELCQAFTLLPDPNLRLLLCGSGDSEAKVQAYAVEDSRIEYRGQLPRDEIMRLEEQATLLVNPRTNNQRFSAYSFPSKILEYLSSGRPVLCHKLAGIPDEYDPYIEYIEEGTTSSLCSALEYMLRKTEQELSDAGAAGRSFVMSNKDPATQMSRLLAFMSAIERPTDDGHPNKNDGGTAKCV